MSAKTRIGGPKRPLTDVYFSIGWFVDEKFKSVVEQLEPDVYQFFPVDFVWKDDSHAWIDKLISVIGGFYVSNQLRDALMVADISGVGLVQFEDVE